MARMTLREAADRTSRSITTLRRYIRSGRLRAEKRNGRYGPEYFVSTEDLEAAGCPVWSESGGPPIRRREERALAPRKSSPPAVPRDSVPLSLFETLQMKHEQLLVQYGMVRSGGLRILELQAELESEKRQAEDRSRENERLREQLSRDTARLTRRLREAELEMEGKRLEIAALKEKIRGLEMLTRNRVTGEAIERQFSQVITQARRIHDLASDSATEARTKRGERRAPRDETDH